MRRGGSSARPAVAPLLASLLAFAWNATAAAETPPAPPPAPSSAVASPPALPLALPDSIAERRVGAGLARFVGDGTAGPYALGGAFVFAGSESVWVGGAAAARGADYTLDANRGSILFTRPIAPGESVVVRYRRLPFALEPSSARWLARPVGTPAESVAVRPAGTYYGKSLFEPGGLRVGGTKSVALVLGSEKDLTLEQALRVSIEGALTRDVSVVARLSDENLPFTPEGSSARLEELDKVFVEVASPHLGATLGDYEVDFRDGEFSTYRRVLKGALGRATYPSVSASASAGVSRGRFLSVELRGEEGQQGPYRLVSREGETVVAGSEELYFDGVRLTRGEDNDYVIDYARGEVRFTSKRPVRTGSRIAVDFQVSGEDYKRSFATASTRGWLSEAGPDTAAGRGATIGITLLSEVDDEEDPVGILLTDADRESLALAGDEDPFVSGAAYVGTGGDYDSTDGRFVFAGRGEGAFQVAFTFLGGGLGRYNQDLDPASGARIFVFDLADSSGDYDPVRRIPRPRSHRVLALDARGQPLPGLSLTAEGASSWLDENTLSDLEDGDNRGGALRLAGEWSAPALTLTARARRLGEGFSSLSRVDPVHFDERWNTAGFEQAFSPDSVADDRLDTFEETILPYREDLLEGSVEYRPLAGVRAGVEAGALSRGDALDSDRGAVRLEAESARLGRAGARAERIRSDGVDGPGLTERLSTFAGTRIGIVSPQVALSREDRRLGAADSLSGSRRDRGVFGATIAPVPALRLGTELVLEDADLVEGPSASLADWFLANEGEIFASLTTTAPFSFVSRYRRRHVDYTSIVPDPDATTHLGRVEIRHRSWDGLLTGEWNYDVTTFSAARKQRVFIEVPEGEVGDFDSLGNFYPGQGRFRVSEIELPAEPTTELTANARFVVEPGQARRAERGAGDGGAAGGGGASRQGEGGFARFLRGLRLETLVSASERSTTPRKERLLLFHPSEFQRDDTTIRGETLVREDATWTAPGGRASVRGRYSRTDVEDNTVAGAPREEIRHEGLLRVRGSVSPRVVAEAGWEPRRSVQRFGGVESSRLDSDFLLGEGTYQPRPQTSISLSGRLGFEREPRLDERLDSFEVTTTVTATVLRRGRVTGSAATLRFLVDERAGGGASPLTTRFEGEEWRLSADYDLSRYLGASVFYTGDNRRFAGPTHLLRVEARALF
jgi:hypothetical protein